MGYSGNHVENVLDGCSNGEEVLITGELARLLLSITLEFLSFLVLLSLLVCVGNFVHR